MNISSSNFAFIVAIREITMTNTGPKDVLHSNNNRLKTNVFSEIWASVMIHCQMPGLLFSCIKKDA